VKAGPFPDIDKDHRPHRQAAAAQPVERKPAKPHGPQRAIHRTQLILQHESPDCADGHERDDDRKEEHAAKEQPPPEIAVQSQGKRKGEDNLADHGRDGEMDIVPKRRAKLPVMSKLDIVPQRRCGGHVHRVRTEAHPDLQQDRKLDKDKEQDKPRRDPWDRAEPRHKAPSTRPRGEWTGLHCMCCSGHLTWCRSS